MRVVRAARVDDEDDGSDHEDSPTGTLTVSVLHCSRAVVRVTQRLTRLCEYVYIHTDFRLSARATLHNQALNAA